MNQFDLGVIVFIVLSGLFAFTRGFVKEVLSIVAWFGASLAALYAIPYLRPIALHFTPSQEIADAGASLVAFIVALVILSIITAAVSRRIKDSPLSTIDCTLGLFFGLARGALLACLGYIALNAVLPAMGATPSWFTQAKTRPLLEEGADALQKLAPHSLHPSSGGNLGSVEQQLDDALKAFSTPKSNPQPAQAAPAYSPQDQRNMDQLFQQNQSH